jgi:hypothetical protein
MCKNQAVDAHHLIDRSLFDDGGYYANNGVSLCSEHHLQAEQTTLSCKELRLKAGITEIVLPEHFDIEEEWDHWGNILLPSGARLKGELFFNDNVQKALKASGILESFLEYVKYSRTYHLPSSPNLQNDDRQHKNVDLLFQEPIIASIKMDGECSSLYPNYNHARSIDSKHHESRSWLKALHGRIAHEIPEGWRICGENLFAKHSIHYQHLKDLLYVYSIWNEKNEALSWEDTVAYCDILGLHTVPVFHAGISCESLVQETFEKYRANCPDPIEGYVVRRAGKIPYQMFRKYTAKYVRAGHVETDEFWMTKPVVPNILEPGPLYTNDDIKNILNAVSEDIYGIKTFDPVPLAFSNLAFSNNSARTKDSSLYERLDVLISFKYEEIFNDMIAFKYAMLESINDLSDSLHGMGNKHSDALAESVLEKRSKLYQVMFCDASELPLLINGLYPKVVSWRLEHGK